MNPLEVFMKKIERLLNKNLSKEEVDTRTLIDLFDLRTNIQSQINRKKSLEDLKLQWSLWQEAKGPEWLLLQMFYQSP